MPIPDLCDQFLAFSETLAEAPITSSYALTRIAHVSLRNDGNTYGLVALGESEAERQPVVIRQLQRPCFRASDSPLPEREKRANRWCEDTIKALQLILGMNGSIGLPAVQELVWKDYPDRRVITIVMDYVNTRAMRSIASLPQIIYIMEAIGRVIASLMESGVVLTDVSVDNLRLCQHGVKVIFLDLDSVSVSGGIAHGCINQATAALELLAPGQYSDELQRSDRVVSVLSKGIVQNSDLFAAGMTTLHLLGFPQNMCWANDRALQDQWEVPEGMERWLKRIPSPAQPILRSWLHLDPDCRPELTELLQQMETLRSCLGNRARSPRVNGNSGLRVRVERSRETRQRWLPQLTKRARHSGQKLIIRLGEAMQS